MIRIPFNLGRTALMAFGEHVTFGYDPARPVLNDISFKVKPKQVVALVGPTGSGKTSIISLVRRFYEVDEGRVLVGGHDLWSNGIDLTSIEAALTELQAEIVS